MNGSSKIFLMREDQANLIPMREQAYLQEASLQELLSRYPDLLPGDQINPEYPRRWLLVSREMGVPGSEEEFGRWSLDHLFLDQDGIPTFVECKRSVDTRTRREVVAQMLDYAANGVEYWNIQRLRQEATETAESTGSDLDSLVTNLLVDPEDEEIVEAYWQKVERNLQHGYVRLIFVADSIPRELRRLVEFLNDKMTDVEVLAVEVKRFQSEEHTVLVPRVIGLTEAARDKKAATGGARKRHTTQAEFMDKLSPQTRGFFEWVVEISQQRGHIIYWGEKGFSVRARSLLPDTELSTFAYGWPTGTYQVYLKNLTDSESQTQRLRQQLIDFNLLAISGNHTLGVEISSETEAMARKVHSFMLEEIERLRLLNQSESM